MVNLKSLDNYKTNLDNSSIIQLQKDVETFGAEELFNMRIKSANCSRVNAWGQRPCQTIDYTYKYFISELVYIIDNYLEDKEHYYEMLLMLHNSNLDYEKINPPVVYKKGKLKDKKEKKVKEPKQKVSKASLKLAAKISKISKLKFKPAQ